VNVIERVVQALNAHDVEAMVACEPGWRTAVGSFVVQEETVTGRGDHEHHVAVYLVQDGVIARERLIA
jgi:hypothetical protein